MESVLDKQYLGTGEFFFRQNFSETKPLGPSEPEPTPFQSSYRAVTDQF